jgi:putative intracellular protease/amidase
MLTLSGKKIAILVADGFEQVEMTEPRKALDEAGAQTCLVSPAKSQVQGWNHHDKADKFEVDVQLDDADVNRKILEEFAAGHQTRGGQSSRERGRQSASRH